MKTDMEANKKLRPIVTELFLRGQKLNILFVFVSQSYFKVPKTIRLNATNYVFMKIHNKRELQLIHQIIRLLLNWRILSRFTWILLKNHFYF